MPPIDPNAIQWDAPPQTVPAPSSGPSRTGGVILTDPTVAAKEARAERTEQRQEAGAQWQIMTPEQKEEMGLPISGVYQRNALGEIKQVEAGPKGGTPQQNALNALQSTGVDLKAKEDRVAELILGSTSGATQNWLARQYGNVTGKATPGLENIAALRAISSDLTLQMTGGSLGNQISNSDRDFITERMGDVGNPEKTAGERLAAWNEVKRRLAGTLAIPEEDVFFQSSGAKTSALDQPGEAPPLDVSGRGTMTAQDAALQRELQAAVAANATPDELQAIATRYGRPFPPEQLEAYANRSPNQRVRVNVSATGESPALGAVAESPVGAFAVGAANALLSGAMDELAPALGMDAAKVQAAKEMLRERYPVSSFAGEVAGAGLQMTGAARALGAAGVAAPRAGAIAEIGGGAAYGAGEAEGGIAERATGAALGAGAALAGRKLGEMVFGPQQQQAIAQAAERAGVDPAAMQQVLGEVMEGTGAASVAREAAETGTMAAQRATPQQIIEAGRAEGVPVLTSDIAPPKTWMGRWLQETGEKLPLVGTGGMRAEQQEAREAAIEGLYDRYQAGDAIIDDVASNFIATRKAAIRKLSQQKREVFDKLRSAPEPVDTTSSLGVIDDAIARYSGREAYEPLVAQLQSWRRDLAQDNIAGVELTRKAIGDALDTQGLQSVRSELRNTANQIYPALRNDMGEHIKKFGEPRDYSKWRAANAELRDFALELEKNTINRVLRTGDATPEEASSLLFSKKPSDVRALFGNLTEDGKRRARSLVVQDLVEKSGGIDELSTAKFITALKKSGKTTGIIFPKEEADRLGGMLRLLQATRRAERAAVTTPTGQATLPFLGGIGAASLLGPWGAAAAGTAAATGYRIYESKAMRNLLASLSKTQSGSRAEANVLTKINGYLAKNAPVPAAVVGTERAVGPDQEQPQTAPLIEVIP